LIVMFKKVPQLQINKFYNNNIFSILVTPYPYAPATLKVAL